MTSSATGAVEVDMFVIQYTDPSTKERYLCTSGRTMVFALNPKDSEVSLFAKRTSAQKVIRDHVCYGQRSAMIFGGTYLPDSQNAEHFAVVKVMLTLVHEED